jgi:SAM-dependent methyltransferase
MSRAMPRPGHDGAHVATGTTAVGSRLRWRHARRAKEKQGMLFGYGMKLGVKLLAHGRAKRGLRYLIVPVNYWRTVEFDLVYRAGDFQSADRILDIGSPKLFSLYLADRIGAQVVATDIEDYFIPEYSLLRELEHVPAERYATGVQDGRALGFPDESFTKVISISVVEHIPDDGDTRCLREIRRVLAPGGRCVLTVPFSPVAKVEYRGQDGFYWAGSSAIAEGKGVFYQRRYDEQQLYSRLIEPSGMTLKDLRFVGERVLKHSEREFCDYLPLQLGPIHPLASRLVHTRPSTSWRDIPKPLCALVVLEKSA